MSACLTAAAAESAAGNAEFLCVGSAFSAPAALKTCSKFVMVFNY